MENSNHRLEDFFVEETSKTPKVDFRKEGKMRIEGASLIDNSIKFYKPLLDWVKKYHENPAILTEFDVKLKHFNISSSKYILDMLKEIESIYKNKNGVIINWYYNMDDEDMLDAGEDFELIIRAPFNFIEVVN